MTLYKRPDVRCIDVNATLYKRHVPLGNDSVSAYLSQWDYAAFLQYQMIPYADSEDLA